MSSLTLTGANWIAGQPHAAQRGDVRSVDPRTRQPGTVAFAEATADEIDAAVLAALDAFETVRGWPAVRLADLLTRIADEIEALGDLLITTADAETGLGIPRLTGERGRTTGQLRRFAAVLQEGSYVEAILDTPDPHRQPAPKPDIRRMQVPLGVVAVFGASNFPLAFSVAGGDTASALAAGCPVIVKAHPSHPATSELVARAIGAAVAALGFPPGMFSMVQGGGVDVGQTLVKHPGIRAVGFTGSLRAGRALFDAAAARPVPIPVYAEMGSVNPMVVLPGALAARLAETAEGLAGSLTLGSGQFCTNPGLVFVPASDAGRQFIHAVTMRMTTREPGVLLNAGIERGLAAAVTGTLAQPGVVLEAGGEPVAGGGYCFQNTVIRTTAAHFIANAALQTEHFGPVVLFVSYADTAELLACLGALHGNLTGTVHATDADDAVAAVYAALAPKVGRLIYNGFPTGVEVGYAMQHGGPYPATTAPATTSVGMTALARFMRPLAYQDVPDALLPPALQNANPLGIWRLVDGERIRA